MTAVNPFGHDRAHWLKVLIRSYEKELEWMRAKIAQYEASLARFRAELEKLESKR